MTESRIIADKIASATKNVDLGKEIRVTDQITAKTGYIVVGRIHGEKSTYKTVENKVGRHVTLHDGDILVGVLGHRNALHGYSGIVPEKISVGDILHVLNLGGVIGQCTSANPEVGRPFDFEVLGGALVFPEFGSRVGVPAHVKMNALTSETPFPETKKVPIVFIAGTCMSAGKTTASCEIIRHLSAAGKKVAACKLTGVSLLRDVLNMTDYGAMYSASFVDAGVVTTDEETAAPTARTILASLSSTGADVIIAELGDGILGKYGVQNILADKEIMERTCTLILCANDPVGAWGGVKLLTEQYGLTVDVISGPTTDNDASKSFIEDTLKIASLNARKGGKALGELILSKL